MVDWTILGNVFNSIGLCRHLDETREKKGGKLEARVREPLFPPEMRPSRLVLPSSATPFCLLLNALSNLLNPAVVVPLTETSIPLYLEGENANCIYIPSLVAR